MRKRFGVLDGIRGIGALTIVVTHSWPLGATPEAGHSSVHFGHLAVDLFFALSGFVISYSYDHRLTSGMTVLQFMKARIVRLYPIFWICALIGAAPYVWEAFHGQGSRARLLVLLLTNLFMLPSPTYPVFPDPFPLDSPAWSLFLELFVANLTYAVIFRYLRTRLLISIIVVSLVWLVAIAVSTGTIDGGSLWRTFGMGIPRVLFSFYVGILIHRIYIIRKPPVIPGFFPLVVIALTFWPGFQGIEAVVYEIFCVAVLYPCLIYLSTTAIERLPAVGAALGNISYSLYLVHIPLLILIIKYISPEYRVRGGVAQLLFIVLSLIAAFCISRFYDDRARSWLARIIQRD